MIPIELLVNFGINGFVATISFYLLILLTFHLIKINLKNDLCNSTPEKLRATTLKIICFFVALLVLVRSLTQFGFLRLNYYFNISGNLSENERADADTICSAVIIISDLTLIFGTGLVYVFLWLRQRIFFMYPELKKLSNNCVKIFSTAVLVVWLLYFAVVAIRYLLFVRYHFSLSKACETVDKQANDEILRIVISWVIMTVLMEISLLGLFLFPLLKRKNWRKKSIKKSKLTSILVMRIKKATALALIAALSDVAAFIVSVENGGPITSAAFNLNMLIDLLGAIGCFDYWRSLLFPCKFFHLESD